jgi:hypothetical protein
MRESRPFEPVISPLVAGSAIASRWNQIQFYTDFIPEYVFVIPTFFNPAGSGPFYK